MARAASCRVGTRTHGGFTLVELLVSFAIMMLMFVMLYGFSSRSHQQTMKRACAKNLQLIHLALQMYATEQTGQLPLVPGAGTADIPLALLVPRYTVGTDAFICPGSKDKPVTAGVSIAGKRISYAYYMGHRLPSDANAVILTDRQRDTTPKLEKQLVFSPDGKPPANNHHQYGGNFLCGDGHVEPSDTNAARALPVDPGIVLLNPLP